MVESAPHGGFSPSLVIKNMYNQDPLKLLKEAKKLLSVQRRGARTCLDFFPWKLL